MTKLWDIPGFTNELWNEMREQKYVNVRKHPTEELFIANYSDKTQVDRVWNPVTMNCRGLIYDGWFNIVARPFKKFFNYGEIEAAEIPLEAEVVVTDKADGSLGIIYPTSDGGHAVATRGSFESEQAIKATKILQGYNYKGISSVTMLVEIIYPENRIVLDYGNEEKLVLLGGVDNEYGFVYRADHFADLGYWNHEVILQFPYNTLAEALVAPPRKNAEGLVVRSMADGSMVKLKQEDYIKLHRLVTGLNERVVWEYLKDHNGEYEGLLEGLPDEFHDWVRGKAGALIDKHNEIRYYAITFFEMIVNLPDRKNFAQAANEQPGLRPYLFMLLDGKSIDGAIWKNLRPVGVTQQMRAVTEDVA